MRVKKGFTLAEILIVLMVIGAIATMTIPSLMRGVTEAQWKTTYKKAYNTVANLTAMERISGQLPSTADGAGVTRMFQSLNANLSVKDYSDAPADAATIKQGPMINTAAFKSGITFTDSTGNVVETGSAGDQADGSGMAEGGISPWITSEDNIAYMVTTPEGGTCSTKQNILSATTAADALAAACVVVVVDVNGLSNGPNRVEPQIETELDSAKAMDPLTGDRYYIYIGLDGATAASRKTSVTGRIVGDLK